MKTDKNVFEFHLFVCTNDRNLPKSGCGNLNSHDLASWLKEEVKKRGLQGKVRVNKSGCLDQCTNGPVMVLYPKGKWFYKVTQDDLPDILREITE